MVEKLAYQKKWMILILLFALLVTLLLPQITALSEDIIHVLQEPPRIQEWLSQYGLWAYLILFFCVILKVIFPILPGKVFEIAAGYCFGFTHALFLLLAANAFATYLIRQFVLYLRKKKDLSLTDEVMFWQNDTHFALILFVIYLLPGTPKDALTYVVALSPMKTWKIVLITTTARSFNLAFGIAQGCALQKGELFQAFLLLGLFALLALGGSWFYRTYILKKNSDAW